MNEPAKFERRDVWELAQPWDPVLRCYATGVARLRARAITDSTSWWFIAAMHGFDRNSWMQLPEGWRPSVIPDDCQGNPLWCQCQHGTWYFLPWHRAYLLMFEAIVRQAIADVPGSQTWALPYWNYSGGNGKHRVPDAFALSDSPFAGANPLYVAGRAKMMNPARLSLQGLLDPDFEGAFRGGTTGIAGPKTCFSHAGSEPGKIEDTPHFTVHSLLTGFMPDTNIAALDPIFWLHHANIDRLWQVWLKRDPGRNHNSSDPEWLAGPADKPFLFVRPDGTQYTCTPAEVADDEALNYCYDNVHDPLENQSRLLQRLSELGVEGIPAGLQPANPQDTEVMGSYDAVLELGGQGARTTVSLIAGPVSRWASSYGDIAKGKEPDRLYLYLENITGTNDAAVFDAFVDCEDVGERSVGLVAMFGVSQASKAPGQGLTKVLDVTQLFDVLKRNGLLNPKRMTIRIAPVQGVADGPVLEIRQITLFRQPVGLPSI